MQLTNAVVGALLAATALASPHPHGIRKGSSMRSRARRFGGNKGNWGQGHHDSSSSSTTITTTTATTAAASSTTDASAAKASSTAATGKTTSSTSSSNSFDSLSTMSNTQWAGAGYSGLYNSGETLKGVSATFNVMDVSKPTDADTDVTDYYTSAWIGIDGQESCTDIADAGLWQAGVDSYLDSDGVQSFYAWYEWYPADTVEVDIGTLSAGDLIFMNLTAASGTKGTIVIENQSTGKSFTETVTSSNEMCLDTIEWIMEDVTFTEPDSGLAAFQPLTFADAVWVTDAGTYPASKANEHYDIKKRTETTVSDESVVVTYV